MNKKKSGKALKIVIWTSAIICVALLVVMCITLVGKETNKDITTEYLQKKAVAKINKYSYAKVILDSEYSGAQDIPNVCEYILTSSKYGTYRTYSYRDKEQDLQQLHDYE